jgi:hypothetical protein
MYLRALRAISGRDRLCSLIGPIKSDRWCDLFAVGERKDQAALVRYWRHRNFREARSPVQQHFFDDCPTLRPCGHNGRFVD